MDKKYQKILIFPLFKVNSIIPIIQNIFPQKSKNSLNIELFLHSEPSR